MYEKLEECPVCKNTRFDNFLICEDHSVSGESFALVKCRKCSLIFTNPRPKEDNLSSYYQSTDYISHTDKGNSLINWVYKLVRKYTLGKKVSIVNRLNGKAGTLLDYGCGTGDFLKEANQKGWHAFGYEPDENAKNIAEKKNPQRIFSTLKNEKQTFDIITAWHVIEHVADLKKTVKKLRKMLNPDGYFILALPNNKSFDAEHYGSYWAAYDVPRHLYHFDTDSIQYFSKQFKLVLKEVLPMKFDSFYVSMLSEKYKGNSNLILAFKTGFKSNKKAKATGEYSSLIYIFSK